MRISKSKLKRASYFAVLYSVICVYYTVDVFLFKDSYIIDVLFFVLSVSLRITLKMLQTSHIINQLRHVISGTKS